MFGRYGMLRISRIDPVLREHRSPMSELTAMAEAKSPTRTALPARSSAGPPSRRPPPVLVLVLFVPPSSFHLLSRVPATTTHSSSSSALTHNSPRSACAAVTKPERGKFIYILRCRTDAHSAISSPHSALHTPLRPAARLEDMHAL